MNDNRHMPSVALIARDPAHRTHLKRKLALVGTVRSFGNTQELAKNTRRVAFAVADADSAADAARLEKAISRSLPGTPALIVSANPKAGKDVTFRHVTAANLANEVRVEVGRALVARVVEHAVVADAIVELAREHGLTSRQMELIAYWTLPLRRAQIAEILAVEESTVKTRVRILLRRFDASSTDEVAKRVLARALTLGLGSPKSAKKKRA
jgi:DNA-binding NarL/FixJ family response regulator